MKMSPLMLAGIAFLVTATVAFAEDPLRDGAKLAQTIDLEMPANNSSSGQKSVKMFSNAIDTIRCKLEVFSPAYSKVVFSKDPFEVKIYNKANSEFAIGLMKQGTEEERARVSCAKWDVGFHQYILVGAEDITPTMLKETLGLVEDLSGIKVHPVNFERAVEQPQNASTAI